MLNSGLYSDSTSFFRECPFSQSDLIQDSMLCLDVRLFALFWSMTIFQIFLVFDNLNSFGKDWSGDSSQVPQVGFVWCFLVIRLDYRNL